MPKKRILMIALAVAVATSTIAALKSGSGASASPTSYTLVCKGGGSMKGEYRATDGRFWFQIRFRKASVGAAERQPLPGECAWVDRPLDPGEPAVMSLHVERTYIYLNYEAGRIAAFDYVGDKSRDLEYLANAIYNSQLFYVQCHLAPSGGGFVIDRVGP